MSGKKPSLIRSALRDMRVNEPLRLSKNGPSFKAPSSEVSKEQLPQSKGPRSGHAQRESAEDKACQPEHAHTEVPRKELVQTENSQPEQPQDEASQFQDASSEPPQNETTQSEVTQIKLPQTEVHPNEDGHNEVASKTVTPTIEVAQLELPQFEQPARGFFRLSDRAFSYPQLQHLSGDCFRLFLWMSSKGWRYQTSDGTLRASVGYIERHTAMSHATISRCLKTLREIALIKLLDTDYKRGNVWRISPIAFAGRDPENLPPRSEGSQNEGTQKVTGAASKCGRASLNSRSKPPQNEGEIRSIKNTKELSQEGAEMLFARLEKVRAPDKQRVERDSLNALLGTYAAGDIDTALSYVEKYGTLSGESCHSPFRYLAKAIDEVMQTCRKKGITSQPKAKAEDKISPEQNEQMRRAAVAAFENELSEEERAKVTALYVEREFTWGYQPSEALLKRLVAFEWYQTRHLEVARAV